MSTTETVIVPIKVTDNGTTAKLNAEAKILNKSYEQVKRTAGETKAVQSAPRKVSAAAAPDSGLGRGATGVGGGNDSKDFARQAQGLGGLVHVYATFAANIFAVTAAFTALSKAADYTNMVKGLDQLGAASGRNLGTMAKSMIELTDGALSLKEAMAATAQGSAAGLSGQQMERMATAAKKASQSLGRDMPDAMNRLSRGITKIEPELLDELGIFVRVDRAAQDYARSIGKTALTLTDFERRQAFANAVLDQAEQKFSAVNLDANPYSKLQATFVDLLYKGGELLNKVLTPIVSIMSASPVALGAVMAGVAGMLLSTAIPALKGWRDNIKLAAKEAKEISTAKVTEAISARTAPQRLAREQAERLADAELGYQDKLLKEMEKRKGLSMEKMRSKDKTLIESLVTKSPSEITDSELNKLDKAAKRSKNFKTELNSLSDSLYYSRQLEREATAAVEAHTAALLKATKASKGYTVESLNLAEARKLHKVSSSMNIVSSSVDAFSSGGLKAGWGEFNRGLEDARKGAVALGKDFTPLQMGTMRLKAGLGMAAAYAGKLMNGLMSLGMYAAIAGIAFQLLDTMLSKNGKQLGAFNASVEASSGAVDNLDRTLGVIADKKPFDKLSSESILAISNATLELSNSLKKVVSDLEQVYRFASGWDNLIDGIKGVVGLDVRSKATNAAATNISSLIEGSINSGSKTELTNELSRILQTDDLSKTGIQKALDKLDTKTAISKLKELNQAEEKFSTGLANSASNLTSYKESLKTTEKALQSMMNSFIPNDHMGKFGIAQMDQAAKLSKALQDPTTALIALSEAVEDFNELKLFPPDVAKQLLTVKTQLIDLRQNIGALDGAIVAQQRNQAALSTEAKDRTIGGFKTRESRRAEGELSAVDDNIKLLIATNDGFKAQAKTLLETLSNTAIKTYEAGVKKVEASWTATVSKSAIELSKSIVSAFTGGPGMASINADLAKQEISLQQQLIKVQTETLIEQQKLILVNERLAIVTEQLLLGNKISAGTGDQKDVDKLVSLSKAYTRNELKQSTLTGSQPEILNKIRGLKGTDSQAFMELGPAFSQLGSSAAQISALGNQAKAVEVKKKVGTIAEETKAKQDGLKTDVEALKIQEQSLETFTSAVGITSAKLELQKETIRSAMDEKNLAIAQADIDKTKTTNALLVTEAKKAGQLSAQKIVELETAGLSAVQKMENDLANTRAQNDQNKIKRLYESDKAVADSQNKAMEHSLKQLDILSDYIGLLEQAQMTTATQALIDRHRVDMQKDQYKFTKEIADKERTRVLATGKAAEEQNRLLDEEKAKMTEIYNLTSALKKAQMEYQKSLVETEDTLRSMEKLGLKNPGEYFSTLADDFNNKLGQMIKAAKSAGDTFNQGLINAMDTTIDKFFDAMQKSELNFKDMVKFARNALSDVFRDTASQMAKNAWKDVVKGIMGPSPIEVAAKVAADASAALQQSQTILLNQQVGLQSTANTILKQIATNTAPKTEGKTGKEYTGGYEMDSAFPPTYAKADENWSGEDVEYSGTEAAKIQQSASERINEASATQSTTALAWAKTTTDFTTNLQQVAAGNMSAMQMFQNLIINLGTTLLTFIRNLSSTMSASSGSSSSGGIFGSIFKTVLGAVGNAIVPGMGSMINVAMSGVSPLNYIGEQAAHIDNAKGGVYGSTSLSAYSNSIVSSPTLFAFAKGGAPNRGLMGEAGPEAIIPLKRDSKGNLGVSGGGGSVNNIEINITIENGQAKQDSSQNDGSSSAAALGNIIKNVVNQELIKQSRPGGILAR